MNQTLITSLAILKVNYDKNRDFFDNFVPFIVESLRLQDEEIISLPKLKDDVFNNFGLEIPQNVIEKILRRAKKKGYVLEKNNVYERVYDKVATSNFTEVKKQVMERHELLVNMLCMYCSDKFEHRGIKWTYEEAEVALNEYLVEHHYVVAKNIRSNTPLTVKENTNITNNYIIGSFINEMQKRYSYVLDYLEEIIKGHMISQAMYFSFPDRLNKRFRGTSVYIDTSLLVYTLGYAGDVRAEPCKELMELLRESGALIFCFRQNLGEITGILDTCKRKMISGERRDGFGTLEYFISKKMTPSDIEVEINRVEARLIKEFNIKVVNNPEYDKYNIDVRGLTMHLKQHIRYNSNMAVEIDVESINSIERIRKGKKTQSIEECKAIFVTMNEGLCYRANNFFQSDYSGRLIPPVITDINLTTILWLKKPTKAPNLPRKRIIADSYAAVQPTERQWSDYFNEIEKLRLNNEISVEEYAFLKEAQEVPDAIMEITLGAEQSFSKATIEEISSLVKEKLVEDRQKEIDQIKNNLFDAYDQISVEMDKRIKFVNTLRDQAYKDAKRIVNYLIFWPTVILFLLLDLFTLLMLPLSVFESPSIPNVVIYLFWSIQVILVIGYWLMDKVKGNNLNQIRSSLIEKIAQKKFRKNAQKYKEIIGDLIQ